MPEVAGGESGSGLYGVCVTLTRIPAIMRNVCRSIPGLGSRSSRIVVLPEPLESSTRIHPSPEVAVHGHGVVVVTMSMEPIPPSPLKVRLVGFSV